MTRATPFDEAVLPDLGRGRHVMCETASGFRGHDARGYA